MIYFFVIIALAAIATFAFRHHQNKLKLRAWLMREAIRNHDFMFHLPVKGLFYGEKALQEALNDLGADINRLVAENEIASWQKLTRVLTHEIMNVATPIQSISQAYAEHPQVKGTTLEKGINAINEASNNLVTFVDSYRKMTQLQEPVKAEMNVSTFAAGIKALYPEIAWRTDIPEDLILTADETLLRQVFVNIIKNAIEAGAKNIGIKWTGTELHISNDGEPITPEVRRDIFVPFYTTKPTGTGIGLALSRQIMTMQRGDLRLADRADAGYHATFVLIHNA